VFGVEVLIFIMRPISSGVLSYLLRPGLWVASLLSLEGVNLSRVGIWLLFGFGVNALLYGTLLFLCWRGWR
jgi:hypothetical protein